MRKIIWSVLGLIGAAVLGIWLVYLPMMMSQVQREPLTTTPASVGLAYRDVAFPSRGDRIIIRAWWMPAQTPKAVVVLVHGANANRQDIYASALPISKFLVSQNISVLALDLRNHGTSDGTPDGKITLGVTESRDVIGAVDFTMAQAPGIPVYVMGASMGGASAIYAAAADKRIKGLVLEDPALNARSSSLHFVEAALHAPGWIVMPIVWSARHVFTSSSRAPNPLQVAKSLTIPILLIKDVQDPVCLSRFDRSLAAHNPHVTLWLVPDPGPNAAGVDRDTFGTHVAAFRFFPDAMKAKLRAFLK